VQCKMPLSSEGPAMETQELHRGRLIDHIQLVVTDLDAARLFYEAVFNALEVPMGGSGDGYFWVDELFVSTPDSPRRRPLFQAMGCVSMGILSKRIHLALAGPLPTRSSQSGTLVAHAKHPSQPRC
jgi:hypothetical protein